MFGGFPKKKNGTLRRILVAYCVTKLRYLVKHRPKGCGFISQLAGQRVLLSILPDAGHLRCMCPGDMSSMTDLDVDKIFVSSILLRYAT